MISLHVDRMIAELLDDPMVQLMMQADSVDEHALAAELTRLACRRDRQRRSCEDVTAAS